MSGAGQDGDRPRTTLQALLQRRNLTQEQAVDLLHRKARQLGLPEFTIDGRQLNRWVTGRVTRPRATARRVLEAEFGYPADVLLGPETTLPVTSPIQTAEPLSESCDFVAWLADNSDQDFESIYQDISALAAAIGQRSPAQHAAAAHQFAAISRPDIVRALREYYGPAGSYYQATVNDTRLTLSVLADPATISLGIPLDPDHHAFSMDQSAPPMPFRLAAIRTYAV